MQCSTLCSGLVLTRWWLAESQSVPVQSRESAQVSVAGRGEGPHPHVAWGPLPGRWAQSGLGSPHCPGFLLAWELAAHCVPLQHQNINVCEDPFLPEHESLSKHFPYLGLDNQHSESITYSMSLHF